MKLRRLLLAAVLAVSPIAALAQQSGVGPTPPAGASPPYAPLGGCVYMPNGVALTGYVGPMGLTCGANGGLNVNVLAGGGTTAATVITPKALTFTHNDQTLAANGTYTVPADTTIKYVDIEVTGTGALRYSIDATAASATHGKALNGAASAAAPQGGGFTYETTAVPQGPLTFYALAATSVEITIGR